MMRISEEAYTIILSFRFQCYPFDHFQHGADFGGV